MAMAPEYASGSWPDRVAEADSRQTKTANAAANLLAKGRNMGKFVALSVRGHAGSG
jgi:hypothetical protein